MTWPKYFWPFKFIIIFCTQKTILLTGAPDRWLFQRRQSAQYASADECYLRHWAAVESISNRIQLVYCFNEHVSVITWFILWLLRYHLASWVNITEQWPYRTSWIILFCEVNEDKIDDFFTLKAVYERVKPFIPVSKELEPFLEIDRDEKKFEIFLSFHRNTLQVSTLLLHVCPLEITIDTFHWYP